MNGSSYIDTTRLFMYNGKYMSERLTQLETQINDWQAKKREAIEVIFEANKHLLELGSERNLILGKTATRHLSLVPSLQDMEVVTPNDVA